MTMELRGRGWCTSYTQTQWSDLLLFAYKQGWKPMGTRLVPASRDPKWEGYYCSNDGQLVVAEDARALAAVLEQSLKGKRKIPKSLNRIRIREMVRFGSVSNFRIY